MANFCLALRNFNSISKVYRTEVKSLGYDYRKSDQIVFYYFAIKILKYYEFLCNWNTYFTFIDMDLIFLDLKNALKGHQPD